MPIKHLFFDLDHTLWDFNLNSRETLLEIYNEIELQGLGVYSFDAFYHKYIEINDALWNLYRKDEISKQDLRSTRFYQALLFFGVDDVVLAERIGDAYIKRCPVKVNLLSGCIEVLDYLNKRYQLHIITNGFEEVQHLKIKASNLDQYFQNVITSEQAGVRKPHSDIFTHALNNAGALAHESVMIGDSLEVDCVPAENLGIQSVFFNPEKKAENKKVCYEIAHLKELIDLF